MTCWPVSSRVGNVKNNDPSLIADCRWCLLAQAVTERCGDSQSFVSGTGCRLTTIEASFEETAPARNPREGAAIGQLARPWSQSGVSVFPPVSRQLRRCVVSTASDAVDREPTVDDQL